MNREDLGVYLAVVSTARPQSVEPMTEMIGEATWYTRHQDEYGDERIEGLCNARNAALTDAFAAGLPCVQVSDDLTKLERLVGEKGTEPLVFREAVEAMQSALALSDARLAGVAPTSNAFYASHKIKRRHFIVGDLVMVEPCDLFFDASLPLKEDYDYTCQHLEKYGAVARIDWILAHFRHRDNAGGAVAVRTPELEQEAIATLMQKWPGWIKLNPKRANEVLLRA